MVPGKPRPGPARRGGGERVQLLRAPPGVGGSSHSLASSFPSPLAPLHASSLPHRLGVGALVLKFALLPGACGRALLPDCRLDETVEEAGHDGGVIRDGVVDTLRAKVSLCACREGMKDE